MRLRLQFGLLALVVGLLWAAYAAVLWSRIGAGPALMLGFLGALFLLLLVASVVELFRSARRRRLLENAGPPSRDGFAACSGRIQPVGDATTAPLSGEPCVLWEYEFSAEATHREDGTGDAGSGKWMGFGHVAMAVETSAGTVPIAGGVLPDEIPRKKVSGEDAEARALELMERPGRRTIDGPFGWAGALGDLERLLSDEDGDARVDYYSGPRREGMASSPRRLRERRLEAGTTVTVLGRYSLAQRAFVASAKGLELHPVSAASLARKAFEGRKGALAFALLTNAFLQTLVVLAYLRGG